MEIILGGLITIVISVVVYFRAAAALKREAESLRRLTVLVIRGLEEGGLAEFSRDESGEPIGLVFRVAVESRGRASASATATVAPPSGEDELGNGDN